MEPTGARIRRAGNVTGGSGKTAARAESGSVVAQAGDESKVREIRVNQHVVGFEADDGQSFPIKLIRRIAMAFLIRFDRPKSKPGE